MPWFWGKTFPLPANDATWPSTPYTPQEFANALRSAAEFRYFSRLAQYGADSVIIQEPSGFNDPWPTGSDGYYVAKFTAQNVVDFITQHLPEYGIPLFGKPIFLVIIPGGSLLDVNALGAHSTFSYNGSNVIWAWMYGSNSLDSATVVATHEIVEAIGANGNAPKELCDDCGKDQPDGVQLFGGTTVAPYFDAQANTCVAPGSAGLPTGPAAQGDDMQPGEVLNANQSISSANGQYTFVYQGDGNLVLYRNKDGGALWASNTDGRPVGVCIMQGDGNLVIYDPHVNPIWSSDTWHDPGSRLFVQDDGNVVIYRPDGTPIWATNTVQA